MTFLNEVTAEEEEDINGHVEHLIEPFSFDFWVTIGICIFLTLSAGLMSGLTVGMMGIDIFVLEMKLENGTPEEKSAAWRLIPILHKHHYLLVTLLLCNATCMEALPIYLDKLVPEFWAILISVTCVLWFGEIIPMAICTGPKQIKIADKLAGTVNFLMIATGIFSYPISLMLDCILGEDHVVKWYNNNDLKTILDLHSKKAIKELEEELGLEVDVQGIDRI